MKKQLRCMRCHKEFGPNLPPDDDYEAEFEGFVNVQYFISLGIVNNINFCPECGKMVWDFAKGLIEETKER